MRMITSNVQRPIGQTTITKQISGGIRIQQNSCQPISTAPRLLNTQVQRTSISQNTQPYTIQNQTPSAIQKVSNNKSLIYLIKYLICFILESSNCQKQYNAWYSFYWNNNYKATKSQYKKLANC